MVKPKKISVRPGNTLEGGGIVVWIYHRKAQIQLQYDGSRGTDYCIQDALDAWHCAMSALGEL